MYTVKSTGKATLKSIELVCPECEYREDRSIDMREIDTPEQEAAAMQIKCPNCDHEYMEREWRTAPSGVSPGTEVDKMKRSFRERFIKKEVDDVRHKHGRLYDDAVVSSAAQRIKDGKKDD